jgi:phospholipase/lecithinase/hemolysin
MPISRRVAALLVAAFVLFPAFGIHAQTPFPSVTLSGPQYTSIVVFGDSLSDTGNDAYLSQQKYFLRIPGPIANYTDGRFTDGTDTSPAAVSYTGTWVEQLAALLPNKPAIVDSLNGGTNYAYGYAFTGSGTTNLVLTTSPITLSVTVDNIGLQISTYLATHPKIDNKTLFVVWGGANDALNATSGQDILNAAINLSTDVYTLIRAGATQIIVPNLPPLGDTPRINGSASNATLYNEISAYYNHSLAQGLAMIEALPIASHASIFQLDVYSLFNRVIAAPATYGFTNVTASSQGLAVNPDQYLFWDSLHPTTHGHNVLANAALQVLNAPPCTSNCPGVARVQ